MAKLRKGMGALAISVIALSVPVAASDDEKIVKVPAGIQCHDLTCVKAFLGAFSTNQAKGWRLFAMEQGRRRAAARTEALFILSNVFGSGSYVDGFWLVKGGELSMAPIVDEEGRTYYRIMSEYGHTPILYVVPTTTKPPIPLTVRAAQVPVSEAKW
jgi:hypothetical protein